MGCEGITGAKLEQCTLLGSEGGSYFDEYTQPDTRTAQELFPGDLERGENAGVGDISRLGTVFERLRQEEAAEAGNPEYDLDRDFNDAYGDMGYQDRGHMNIIKEERNALLMKDDIMTDIIREERED